MKKSRILVVEDEPAIREMIVMVIGNAGYEVDEAGDTETARKSISKQLPDLILLDWMLPGQSGVSFAKSLKQNVKSQDIPVILLTARDSEADKVLGFESGADDYVTKPFSVLELVARVKALLRRTAKKPSLKTLEGLDLDQSARRVSVMGKKLELAPMEYELLSFFITHPERVFSRAQLLDLVWGIDAYVDERTVDVHIQRLRKLLDPHDLRHLLQTVRGVGYRFSSQE